MSVMRGPEEDETGTGAGADPHLSDVEIEAERGVLVRPSCGNSYLHHGTVTVFDRREDAPRVRVTEVSAEMVLARVRATKGSGNPSTRRDGLTIAFDYECCPTRLKLELAQHKSETMVSWALDDRVGDDALHASALDAFAEESDAGRAWAEDAARQRPGTHAGPRRHVRRGHPRRLPSGRVVPVRACEVGAGGGWADK